MAIKPYTGISSSEVLIDIVLLHPVSNCVVLKFYHDSIPLSFVGYIILHIVTKENFKKLNILFRKS